MNFSVLPPEVNSASMYAGAGSGPMLAAAAAWDGLAAELNSAAASFASTTSGLVGSAWQGASSTAMMAAATPYVRWLSTAATQAGQAAGQAQLAATNFEAALAAMVHPATVATNRTQLVSLAVSNLLGQNAPAIAETEVEYEQMWAQDVAALFGYHADASAVASALTPFAQWLKKLAGLAGQGIAALNFNAGSANPCAAARGSIGRCASPSQARDGRAGRCCSRASGVAARPSPGPSRL